MKQKRHSPEQIIRKLRPASLVFLLLTWTVRPHAPGGRIERRDDPELLGRPHGRAGAIAPYR
ncbi:MAG TPA: hypothetical protein VMZ31_09110 [Phycisphaerae bacterium]|nr:hypothetical protein [Phycisphaerae bacterium]